MSREATAVVAVVFAASLASADQSGGGAPLGSAPAPGSPTGFTPGQIVGSPTGFVPGQNAPPASPSGADGSAETSAFPAPALADRRLAAKLRRAIMTDPTLTVLDLRVRPLNGKILLQGSVGRQVDKDRISRRAADIVGNGNVDNEITVGLVPLGGDPTRLPPGVEPPLGSPTGSSPGQNLGSPTGSVAGVDNNAPLESRNSTGGSPGVGLADRMLAGQVRRAVFSDPD